MAKVSAVAVLWLCFSCGGSSGNAPPAQQAESEPQVASPAQEEAAPPEGSTETTSESSSEPSEPPAEEKAAESPKRACDQLDKSTCKVTVGCAWNDQRKCLKE